MAKPKRPQHGSQHNGQRPGGTTNAARTNTTRATGQTGSSTLGGQGAQTRSGQGTQVTRATQPTTAASARPSTPAERASASAAARNTAAARATTSSTSGRYRPLATREPQSGAAARHKPTQQPWWQKNMTTLIAVGSVALLIVLFVAIAYFARGGGNTSGIGDTPSAQVLKSVTQPNAAIFDQVGSGGIANPFKRVGGSAGNGGDFLKGPDGKPEFFYAGAEYCPFCAAERWSIIMALSRFGSFSGLKQMQSADSPEVYPNTATFTFVDASYTSDYISFSRVELQDRSQATLQTPTAQQSQIMKKYNSSQYYGQDAGGIPFLSVANQYLTISSGYNPGILDNLTWQDISQRLTDPKSQQAQDIVGNANWITAAICQTTNQNPGSVCKSKAITDLEKQL